MSPALIGGSLTTTSIPNGTVLLSGVSSVGHIHRRICRTSHFRLRNGAWSDQGLQVQEPEGPQTGYLTEETPQAGWDPLDQGAPTGIWSCQVTPACMSSGHLCLLHSVPRSPGLGSAGPPQPLSAAGDELGVPPAALGRLGGQSWVLQREMRKPPVGIFKENTLEQRLLDSGTQWPHSAPQPPCKCKSWRSQPSNLGGIWGQDLYPGETCSGHPPLICMHGLLPPSCLHFCGHTQQQTPVFLLVILKPTKWVEDMMETCALLCLTFSPRSHIHSCFSWSSLLSLIPPKTFLQQTSK